MSLHHKKRLTPSCVQLESRLAFDASGHLALAPIQCGAAEPDQGQVRFLLGDPPREGSHLPHSLVDCRPGGGSAADVEANKAGTVPGSTALSASLIDQAFALPNAGVAASSPHNPSTDSERNQPFSVAAWTGLGDRQALAPDNTCAIIEPRALSTEDTDHDRPLWEQACAYVLKQAAAHRTLRYRRDLHDDLVQEVYLDWCLWQQRAGKPTDSPPLLTRGSPERADFQRAVERVFARARTRLKRQPELWDLGREPAQASAVHEHAWGEVERALTDALESLSPEQRRVVAMHEEGKTFEEIGRELGCSKQRAWRAWDRAYSHVRTCLEKTSA